MNYFLAKTDPETYSIDDLEREKKTIWDGVSNPVALKNLRGMKAGDKLIIYETGDTKSAVGTATVVSVDADDPKNPQVAARLLGQDVPLMVLKIPAMVGSIVPGCPAAAATCSRFTCRATPSVPT